MAKIKFDKEALRERLNQRAKTVAGEITKSFFESVSDNMPVENGHAHESFGSALQQIAELPEIIGTASQMLSKGSGDAQAASGGYGKVVESTNGIKVTVGTSVGFVKKLDDGDTITVGDGNGSTGWKEPGTQGQLYGRRYDHQQGFLMWNDAGGKHFALSVTWGPLGFFEQAAEAARNTANQLGVH